MRQTAAGEIEHLWYTRCPVPSGSGIAVHHGWLSDEFKSSGIEVTSLTASGDAGVRASHFDHRQANSFRQGGNAPPIWARSEGQDVVVVGLTWLPQYQAILAMPGSGIKTITDTFSVLMPTRRRPCKIVLWMSRDYLFSRLSTYRNP